MTVYLAHEPAPKRFTNARGFGCSTCGAAAFAPHGPDCRAAVITNDYSAASRYGRIETVFHATMRPEYLPGRSIMQARKVLRAFDRKTDYLLYAGGSPIAFGICCAVLHELCPHGFRVLSYEKADRAYIPVELSFHSVQFDDRDDGGMDALVGTSHG